MSQLPRTGADRVNGGQICSAFMVTEMTILEDGYLKFQDLGPTVKDPLVCHEHCVLCKEIGERLRIVVVCTPRRIVGTNVPQPSPALDQARLFRFSLCSPCGI
jgi:hypothetical protein